MSLTSGFLLLFFTIVVPGFLFLRTYYYGEFSKQFNPKENITKHLLFGLIPGSIIQLLCFLIGKKLGWVEVDSLNILAFFETVNSQKVGSNKEAQELISNPVYFGYYLLIVYVISFLAGAGISRFIRLRKWDKSIKVLRYKNQWYYVFSGEIFELKKFQSAANILGRNNLENKDVQLARVDVLISNGGRNEFYSGVVVDYDLLPDDPSKLDNLYLMNAYRYERKELKNDGSFYQHPQITARKHIPGEVFVLNMCNLVNINVSYLLTEKKPKTQKRWVRNLLITLNTISLSILLFLVYPVFWKVDWIKWDVYRTFMAWAWWLDKILLMAVFMSILSFATTSVDDETGLYQYTKRDIWINTIALLISTAAFFSVYYLV